MVVTLKPWHSPRVTRYHKFIHMYKCTLIKDGIDCTVEMRETRKCQNKLPQMVYCSNFMVFCHIETLHNYQIISLKKNPLTEVPFNRTRFIEEVDSICSPQHGSSCGLNCDSPSPKKCTQVLTPDACESDPNLFGIRIFADILRTSLVAQGVKNPPAMQDTQVQSLGWEDSPGEGNGYPLQYSCLENSMDRGAWGATVHGAAKSWTWLSN